MSITIPKIIVSSRKKREKLDLSFDCSTTANFGQVQPTMARELVPNSKVTVKVGTVMRLAPMPTPTFGRMYIKHTHVFVPYIDVCPQFNELLTGQSYVEGGGSAFVPLSPCLFDPYAFAAHIIVNHSYFSIYSGDSSVNIAGFAHEREEGTRYLRLLTPTNATNQTNLVTALNNIRNIASYPAFQIYNSGDYVLGNSAGIASPDPDNPYGCLLLGDTYFSGFPGTLTSNEISVYDVDNNPNGRLIPFPENSSYPKYVSLESADFIGIFGSFTVAFKLKPYAKRLRSIFLGLGYPFTPNLANNGTTGDFNALKLFAFYKAWFNLFRPKREYSFTNTSCYALIKAAATVSSPTIQLSSSTVQSFIDDLANCFCYLPMDYFGMSVKKPYDSNGNDISLKTYESFSSPSQQVAGQDISTSIGWNGITLNPNLHHSNNTNPPQVKYNILPFYALPFAEKLMHYANKNTVAGKSVRNILKAVYGIDPKEDVNNELIQIIGSSQTNVFIKDIMNQAETSEGVVGEYAGFGKAGDNKIISFSYETKDKEFGVWITLSYVMPVSGYYQGYMLENRQKSKYDFYIPDFDAAGYQLIERGEVSTDYPVGTLSIKNLIIPTQGFGFVPRYSHLKVSKNIVNGDLSLRGLYNSMSPYTLDRMFQQIGKTFTTYTDNGIVKGGYTFKNPDYYPTTINDDFRKVDSSSQYGNYNRVFYYVGSDFDHFIINCIFDVKLISPLKSLSDSFDTICDDEQYGTEIEHS